MDSEEKGEKQDEKVKIYINIEPLGLKFGYVFKKPETFQSIINFVFNQIKKLGVKFELGRIIENKTGAILLTENKIGDFLQDNDEITVYSDEYGFTRNNLPGEDDHSSMKKIYYLKSISDLYKSMNFLKKKRNEKLKQKIINKKMEKIENKEKDDKEDKDNSEEEEEKDDKEEKDIDVSEEREEKKFEKKEQKIKNKNTPNKNEKNERMIKAEKTEKKNKMEKTEKKEKKTVTYNPKLSIAENIEALLAFEDKLEVADLSKVCMEIYSEIEQKFKTDTEGLSKILLSNKNSKEDLISLRKDYDAVEIFSLLASEHIPRSKKECVSSKLNEIITTYKFYMNTCIQTEAA